jgi:hypothetical protein
VVIENVCDSWDWTGHLGLLFPKCRRLVLKKCNFVSGEVLRGWSSLTELKLCECSPLSLLWLPVLVTLRLYRTPVTGTWAPRATALARNVYLDRCTEATQVVMTCVGAVKVSLAYSPRAVLKSTSWARTLRVLRFISVSAELVLANCVCPFLSTLQISRCSVSMAGLALFVSRSAGLRRVWLDSLMTASVFTEGFSLGKKPVSFGVTKLVLRGMPIQEGTRGLVRCFPNLVVLDALTCWVFRLSLHLIPYGHSLRNFRGSPELGLHFLPNTLATLVVCGRLAQVQLPVRLLGHPHLTRLCLLGGLSGGDTAELSLTRALAQNRSVESLSVQGVGHESAWLSLLRARKFVEFELPENKLPRLCLLGLLRLAVVQKQVSHTLNLGAATELKVAASGRLLSVLRQNTSIQALFLRNWRLLTRFGQASLRQWVNTQTAAQWLVFGTSRSVNHALISRSRRELLGLYLPKDIVEVIVKLAAL